MIFRVEQIENSPTLFFLNRSVNSSKTSIGDKKMGENFSALEKMVLQFLKHPTPHSKENISFFNLKLSFLLKFEMTR